MRARLLSHTGMILLLAAAHVSAQTVSYEGTSFPDAQGWARSDRPHLADRWLSDGALVQEAEIVDAGQQEVGEDDFYRRSLGAFSGAASMFFEWRMLTDGPREAIPDVAPAALAISGQRGIRYHFTIARDRIRFIDSQLDVLYVDTEVGVLHTYRLELRTDQTYAWFIDAAVVDAGPAPQPYPTVDSVIVFGARASVGGGTITARWDYIRYGVIPVDASGDYDSDGVVTLDDFYFFHECLSNRRPGINGGPGNDAGPGCRFADFNADASTDLSDFATFQLRFGVT